MFFLSLTPLVTITKLLEHSLNTLSRFLRNEEQSTGKQRITVHWAVKFVQEIVF